MTLSSPVQYKLAAIARGLLSLAAAVACATAVSAQTVTLTDEGPAGSGTTYFAGDGWLIQISNGTPGAGVDMCDPSGCTQGGYYGNTDANGNFSLSGQFASNDSGYWSETWYVGGAATNTLSFYVWPPYCAITPYPGSASISGGGFYGDTGSYDSSGYPIYQLEGYYPNPSPPQQTVSGSTATPGCTISGSLAGDIAGGDQQSPVYGAATTDSWTFYVAPQAFSDAGVSDSWIANSTTGQGQWTPPHPTLPGYVAFVASSPTLGSNQLAVPVEIDVSVYLSLIP